MKTHLFRLTGILVATLLLSQSAPASAAPDKKSKTKAPVTPTDQLEAARTATRKLPALAADATIQRDSFQLHLKVRRVGDDWDLIMTGKQSLRLLRKDGSYYVSDDDGKTWRPTEPDDSFVTLVLSPLESGQIVGSPRRATYEALGKEPMNGVDLLHLRMVPEKDDKTEPNELAQEWLTPEGRNGWLVRRSRVPVILFKHTAIADVVYEPLRGNSVIASPEVKIAAPVAQP